MTTTEGATAMNATTCNHEAWDGNRDDPSYYYCDLPHAHAGEHHYSI